MAGYRLYFLDRLGHIESTKEVQCSSDTEAIAALEAEGCYAELWERDRFIRSADVLIGVASAGAHTGPDQSPSNCK